MPLVAETGIHAADDEEVQLRFAGADPVLPYIDRREEPRQPAFGEALGFRWNGEFEMDEGTPRIDIAYEVHDSPSLGRQRVVQPRGGTSRKLCFNACGVLDVLCRRNDGARQ